MSFFDASLGPIAAPSAVLDRATFERNLDALRTAAGGVTLRIATKSIRVRGLVEWALTKEGVDGVLSYSLREALWLARHGVRDVLVAYPSVDLATMREIASDATARTEITLMVDSPEHVEMAAAAARDGCGPLRLALDVDMSLRIGRFAVGAHRSNVHTADDAVRMARLIASTAGVDMVGCMFYEAQVAGVPDSTPGHRLMKRVSMRELVGRRHALVEALRAEADLQIVNGGGTGSAHITGRDGVLTDIAVGSGLFSPRLFDHYRSLHTEPACYFVSPVVRKPEPSTVVTYSGGYIGSGPPSRSRVPHPVHPDGLKYFGQLGAGEVQTPLHGDAARALEVGDHVWFRHSKAGEMCERFDEILVVDGGAVRETLPTYRGEGQNFG